ncbi:acyl-CoA thioesterase [Mariniflexile sp. AS56]|uniref:acyl-CoA thioesterase n=1 Tax=Mariniflexile sp. AS56 TaxID=3063957 RepID=UPI0026F2956C|nr:thioesterase family protein [Mariniflexile sp. AS56]MDO7173335.1 thioesterase family protein [Mariniflexile sp. AS56]
MQTFETSLTVTENDLDELNHVNNIRYVQWVQDIAKAHWLKNASENILKTYHWVMLSHYIEYKGSALLDDVVTIKTYVVDSKGATSMRMVEIYNDAQKLLTKSETSWCLINTKTKRPARITPEIIDLFN